MKSFKVCFVVMGEEKLGTVLATVAGEVRELSINEVGGDKKTRVHKKRSGVSAIKDTRLGKFVMGLLPPGKQVKLNVLQDAVEKEGFARSSASSTLSALVRDKEVIRPSEGVYQKA
jgi:hypothetical protein